MKKILKIENLKVDFNSINGKVYAVRGVDLHINKGEIVSIVGESGCGKSVTAKSIMGLIDNRVGIIDPNSKIFYKGKNILEYDEKEWNNYRGNEVSIIFQDAMSSLNPTIKIGNQIVEGGVNHKKIRTDEAEKKAINMLKYVGIEDAEKRLKQYPFQLSGGQCQRVMIASALATNPNILIADEPTTALDVTVQAQIISILKRIKDEKGTSILLITHDLGVVADLSDRIYVMYLGEIMESGNVRDIFYNYKHPYTYKLLNAAPRLDLESKQELETIKGTPPSLLNPPQGCPFASRCDYSMEICGELKPPKFYFENNHYSRCWLNHNQAEKNKKPFTSKDVIKVE